MKDLERADENKKKAIDIAKSELARRISNGELHRVIKDISKYDIQSISNNEAKTIYTIIFNPEYIEDQDVRITVDLEKKKVILFDDGPRS